MIISEHINAMSQLADYQNCRGKYVGKPVFINDLGNLLQVEGLIPFEIAIWYFTIW